jgi:hypothetical protein
MSRDVVYRNAGEMWNVTRYAQLPKYWMQACRFVPCATGRTYVT